MKITDYEALRRQLNEMQEDPELTKELKALEGLENKATELGYSREQAARLLHPIRFHGATSDKEPILNIKRRPKDFERQLMLYEDLKVARAQIDVMMTRISGEPGFEHRRQLADIAHDHDFTPAQASQILHPDLKPSVGRSAPAHRTNNGNTARRRMRYWKNPHDGEVARGRNVNIRQLNQWKAQYGQQIVTDWEISAEEADQ